MRTANSFKAVGAFARHGPGFEPPLAAMTMGEANALVREVAARWLDRLVDT
jgi:hypothetical protein